MSFVRTDIRRNLRVCFAASVAFLSLGTAHAYAQFGGGGMPGGGGPSSQTPLLGREDLKFRPEFTAEDTPPVVEVRIVGAERVEEARIRSHLKTRPGRNFDPELVQADVRRLMASGSFRDVRPYNAMTAQGLIVTFEVFERPTVRYVKYYGNQTVADKTLAKEADIKVGDSLNYYAVEEARRQLQDYYRSAGYADATVGLLEGDQPQDRGVAFVFNEGKLQRIRGVDFTGNTIASDGRLKTQIQSKPGFLWLFKGRVQRATLDEDIERLTAYYRGLGFFKARIGRELSYSNGGGWVTINFIIDEGPRYKVRNLSFVGNQKFSDADLQPNCALVAGDVFDLRKLNRDVIDLRDLYGSQGHIFADIQAEPRFLEEPGQLDLVYDIDEGDLYRVGSINVRIGGENPHTRRSVVLPRLSFQPGDVVDIRQIRDSERRLKHSQLFAAEPGKSPRIVVRPNEKELRR